MARCGIGNESFIICIYFAVTVASFYASPYVHVSCAVDCALSVICDYFTVDSEVGMVTGNIRCPIWHGFLEKKEYLYFL